MLDLQEDQKKHVKKATFGLYHVYSIFVVIMGLALAPNTTILDKLCILGICVGLAIPINFVIDKIWAFGRKMCQKKADKKTTGA